MRIIFIGPSPTGSPTRHPGGQLTAALGIAEYARARGHSIEAIDTSVDAFSPPSLARKIRTGLVRVARLQRLLLESDTGGVILFGGARLGFFERVAQAGLARMRGVPSLLCIRAGDFVSWAESSPVLRFLVARCARIPTRVVVQGTRTARALEQLGVPASKIGVVHNWLPPAFDVVSEAKPAPVGRPLRLLFVGWLMKEKGIVELLDAYAVLSARYSLHLDIVGGGTLASAVRERIAAEGLEDCVVHDWVTPDRVRELLDAADVFVLPSYFEGFPNALLEAMARGLPAVCTDVGGISDSILEGASGYLVAPGDADGLARAIEHYAAEPMLVHAHSQAALEQVRRIHDWSRNLTTLFSFMASRG